MGIGTSIFLIALGAILAFAVHVSVAGISIQTVGVILMIAGIIGLIVSALFLTSARRREPRTVVRDREVI